VVASGARFTGPTIHFVNEKFDDGKILAQRVVPVFPTDTPTDVAARVLEKEHEVFPHALAALVEGRVEFREDGVPRIVARGTEDAYE
jgi:phosphoribosylglycinamide formyltransferase